MSVSLEVCLPSTKAICMLSYYLITPNGSVSSDVVQSMSKQEQLNGHAAQHNMMLDGGSGR